MAGSICTLPLRHEPLHALRQCDSYVNNAGIVHEPTKVSPVWEVSAEQWEKTMDVNVNGVFYGLRAATAQMIKQDPHSSGDRGWVVNLASVFGLVSFPNICPSCSLPATRVTLLMALLSPVWHLQTRSHRYDKECCTGLCTLWVSHQLPNKNLRRASLRLIRSIT